jgi:hypothetical protein
MTITLLSKVLRNYGHFMDIQGDEGFIVEDDSKYEQIDRIMDTWAMTSKGYRIEIVNDDQIFNCDSCNQYFWRDSGYHYNYHWVNDCELFCHDCYEEYVKNNLEDFINNPEKAVPKYVDLSEWENLGEFENGMYNMVDDPKKVFEKFQNDFSELVFQITDSNPFAVWFTLYGRNTDENE